MNTEEDMYMYVYDRRPYANKNRRMFTRVVTIHRCIAILGPAIRILYRDATQLSRCVSRYHKWRIIIRQRMYRDTRSDVQ